MMQFSLEEPQSDQRGDCNECAETGDFERPDPEKDRIDVDTPIAPVDAPFRRCESGGSSSLRAF